MVFFQLKVTLITYISDSMAKFAHVSCDASLAMGLVDGRRRPIVGIPS